MSVLRRGFIIAGRHLFYTLSISVIVVMLVIAGIVWLSATVTERKDDIASWVSQQIGYEVSIGSAGLYWLDLFPKLQLDNVTVLQDGVQTPMVTADTLRLELDLLATLQQRSLELSAVNVGGLQTETIRSVDNQFSLAGQRPRELMIEVEDVIQRLDQITLENADITHRDAAYPSLNGLYRITHAELSHNGEDWHAQLLASPPAEIAERVEFDLLLTLTNTEQLFSAEGDLYVKGFELADLQTYFPQALPVLSDSGKLDIQAQGNWQQDSSEVDADVDLRGLNLRRAPDSDESLPLEALQGNFQWQHQAQTWQLLGRGLQIQGEDGQWPETSFTAESDSPGQLSVSGNYLQLSDLHAFAVLLPDLPESVADAKAAGEIRDYQLAYDQSSGLQSLTAAVNQLSTAPTEDFPGVGNLSFDIDWQPDAADLSLRAEDWQLFAAQWLPETLWFASTTGELKLRREADGWHARADALRVLNDDLGLFFDGSLRKADEQMLADIALQIDDLAVEKWLNYVPEQVLDPTFLKWSRQAFQAGTVESLTFELQGDLKEFPFESEQPGAFSADMQVRDATLQYAPDWPALTAVDAQIRATGNQLRIIPDSGQTAGFEFGTVNALIEQIFEGKPQLALDGQLNGTTTAALDFLQDSPLQSRYGKVTDWLSADGLSDIDLHLAIPLLSSKETEVSGSVGFDNSRISLTDNPDASVTQLNGRLSFSNNGIAAENLQGEFLQRPVSVRIEPTDGSTRIIATGRLPVSEAEPLMPGKMPDFISGETAFEATINISEPAPGEFRLAVQANSDLDGIAIDLPEPLGKSANQKRQLSFDMQAADNQQFTLEADIEDSFQLVHQTGPEKRTILALGRADDALPQSGFAVRAAFPELDLDTWQAWYQDRQKETTQSENGFMPDAITANIDTLTFLNQSLEQFDLQADRVSDEWLLEMDAKQLKGSMRLPMADTALTHIDLERLYWQLPERDDQSVSDQTSTAKRTSIWPAMKVHIGDLQVDDMKLGTLQLEASREGRGWILDSASLESAVLQASAQGRWQQFENEAHSRFSVTFNSDDVAGLLSELQYQPVIDARNAQVDVNIEWPADPLGFSRNLMEGNMMLSTGRGQLREVEPGAAGRVFGLLSLAAIPRRLSLDFSDLFDEGLAFNSISGRFDFADGIAHTDDLRLQAQSAVINIQGPVNLVERTYDQTVKITPNVSSTLPLAGAVAGGPVGLGVGTAIMLADRLVGRVFDRDIVDFISYRYRLTGPWNDPEMDLITSNDQ